MDETSVQHPTHYRDETAKASTGLQAAEVRSAFEVANEELAKAISSLGNTVDHLGARLSPILYPSPPEDTVRSEDPIMIGSDVVTALREHTRRLGYIEQQVGRYGERAEV